MGLVMSVEISSIASRPLNEADTNDLLDIVAQGYDVDREDLTSVIGYVASGTMLVDIPDTMSEVEALSVLTISIAENIGVEENTITLSIDPESAEIIYSITTDDFEASANILEQLQDSAIVNDLSSSAGVAVSEVISDNEIIAEVNIIVNGDDIEVPLQQAENVIDALLGDEYTSVTEVKYVTSTPSEVPTIKPSDAPISNIPTSMPSISGAVVFIEMQQLVTEMLTDEEIDDIVTSAENSFGLFPENLAAEVSYDITGTIDITVNEDISDEDLIATLQDSISKSLNVHPSDVSVDIDAEGVVGYTISSPTVEEATTIHDVLQEDSTIQTILDEASSTIPTITMVSNIFAII